MKYAFMQAHRNEFSVVLMPRVFAVAKSGFYAWRAQVKSLFFQFKPKYGAPRLANELVKLGKPADKKIVADSIVRAIFRS